MSFKIERTVYRRTNMPYFILYHNGVPVLRADKCDPVAHEVAEFRVYKLDGSGRLNGLVSGFREEVHGSEFVRLFFEDYVLAHCPGCGDAGAVMTEGCPGCARINP